MVDEFYVVKIRRSTVSGGHCEMLGWDDYLTFAEKKDCSQTQAQF